MEKVEHGIGNLGYITGMQGIYNVEARGVLKKSRLQSPNQQLT